MTRVLSFVQSVHCRWPQRRKLPLCSPTLEPAKGILVRPAGAPGCLGSCSKLLYRKSRLPEFEIENAIVVLPQDRPQNTNEQIGGSHLRWHYADIYHLSTATRRLPTAARRDRGALRQRSAADNRGASRHCLPLAFMPTFRLRQRGSTTFCPRHS